MAGTDGCTNLQLGHAGEDLQSMTRRWQLTHGTATIGPNEPMPPPPLLMSSSTTAVPELALPPSWKVDGIVEMLSSRSRVLPCSSMGLTQLFLMVFLFRSRHCSQSRGRGSLRWSSRLGWDTASSQAKCFLLFLLLSSLLPSDSDDELLAAPVPKPSDVGPRESSGCTSIDPILSSSLISEPWDLAAPLKVLGYVVRRLIAPILIKQIHRFPDVCSLFFSNWVSLTLTRLLSKSILSSFSVLKLDHGHQQDSKVMKVLIHCFSKRWKLEAPER